MHMSEKSNERPTTITGVLTILRAEPVSKKIVATILLNCGWNDGDLMMMTVAVPMKWDTMMTVAVKKKNLIQLLKLIISLQWSFIRKLTYSLWLFYIFTFIYPPLTGLIRTFNWPAPSGLRAQLVRALHQYRSLGYGRESCSRYVFSSFRGDNFH